MASEDPIHFFYRLTFNYVEPLFATLGVIGIIADPETVVQGQTPHAAVHYSKAAAQLRPLTFQTAGGWALLAFHDVFLLRYTKDVNIWKLILAGGLISDIFYSYSIWLDIGTAQFIDPRLWSAADSFLVLTTIYPLLAKVSFLLGIGLKNQSKAKSS